MRLKFNRDDPNTYRCCFCCHVRTGTIFLGLWHLLMHLVVIGFFIMIHLRPDLMQQWTPQTDEEPNSTELIDGNDSPYQHDEMSYYKHKKWTSDDKLVALLITVGSFAITSMLVYGAARGRAGYLMPFFCLQVFDFCISSLTIVGYFSYMPDIKQWIGKQKDVPFKEQLLQWDADWLMLIAVGFFVLIMTMKAYFIGVVWACYKYLQNNASGGSIMTRRIQDYPVADDSEMLLPPKYEDAVRQAANEPPPPTYVP